MHDWNTRKTREQSRRNICNNDVWEFSEINYRDQPPTNPGGSENTKMRKGRENKRTKIDGINKTQIVTRIQISFYQ